jgi:hypothetical protein
MSVAVVNDLAAFCIFSGYDEVLALAAAAFLVIVWPGSYNA